MSEQANGVSFATQILPLWTSRDVSCMSGFGVMLNQYSYMSDPAGGQIGSAPAFADHVNARSVDWYLASGRMPQGEAKWVGTPKLKLYEQWMADGFLP